MGWKPFLVVRADVDEEKATARDVGASDPRDDWSDVCTIGTVASLTGPGGHGSVEDADDGSHGNGLAVRKEHLSASARSVGHHHDVVVSVQEGDVVRVDSDHTVSGVAAENRHARGGGRGRVDRATEAPDADGDDLPAVVRKDCCHDCAPS